MIQVSPTHQIELDEALVRLFEHPMEHDYVVRRLSLKSVNGEPLIQGELVIAGKDTLAQYPLAKEYPLHFRKTYYPICFHQNPEQEFDNQLAASQIIDVPPPIGSTRTTFRSCFLPGTPLNRMSPFGVEPEDRNIQIATETSPATSIGLWYLLAGIYRQVLILHEHGFAHGDLFLHNVIVSPTPISTHLIDFEQAVHRGDEMSDDQWQEKRHADLLETFKHAIYLQCSLGPQQDELGVASLGALEKVVGDPDRFQRAIARMSSRV